MEYELEVLHKAFKNNSIGETNIEKKLSTLPGKTIQIVKENLAGVPIYEVCEKYNLGHPAARKIVKNKVVQAQKVANIRDRLKAKLAAKTA